MKKLKLLFKIKVGLKTWWFHADGKGILTAEAGGTKQKYLKDFYWSWDVQLERVAIINPGVSTAGVVDIVRKRATTEYLLWRFSGKAPYQR